MAKAAKKTKWREKKDDLFRGDDANLTRPDPSATKSLVPHILFLGGAGRPTPYHSTTESTAVASEFAGKKGKIFKTTVPKAQSLGLGHLGKLALMGLLRGKGKGHAAWHSPYEIMQARKLVEQHLEHLIDFSGYSEEQERLSDILSRLY